MGEYVWRTYVDVEKEARHFGAGLRELGCQPRQNIVMFAETRAEWMLAAHGCFKQSIPGETLTKAFLLQYLDFIQLYSRSKSMERQIKII